MHAIITVGLGFGDEGKGATVDSLARAINADLVVRYCGASQAGHNVQLPDGRRHTFAQFGAGTFAGAKTYLGPRVIISPATMVPEANHLLELGVRNPWSLLGAHPECLVSTTYHMLMNRLREFSRGSAQHGSCGLGIGETRHYWLRYGRDAIFARDLGDTHTLVSKLTLIKERLLLDMQQLPCLSSEWSEQLRRTAPYDEAEVLRHSAEELQILNDLPECQAVLFEGAQGVLLDEWKGFHPHTTWSTVPPQHAFEILDEQAPTATVTVLGITRAFTTRHGAGPLPTWSTEMTAQLVDPGNPTNPWQGSMRAGALDLVLVRYAAQVCQLDGIVVNCLDQLPTKPRICNEYLDRDRLELPHSLRQQQQLTTLLERAVPVESEAAEESILAALDKIAPVVGTSHGPTSLDRQFTRALQKTAVQGLHKLETCPQLMAS